MRQLEAEHVGVVVGGEVLVLLARGDVAADHAVDELAQGGLARRGADRTAEVLRGDDVARVDRPGGGELHAALLEVDRAVAPVGHHDVAPLPRHGVVGVDAGRGVQALHAQPLRRRHLGARRGDLLDAVVPSGGARCRGLVVGPLGGLGHAGPALRVCGCQRRGGGGHAWRRPVRWVWWLRWSGLGRGGGQGLLAAVLTGGTMSAGGTALAGGGPGGPSRSSRSSAISASKSSTEAKER